VRVVTQPGTPLVGVVRAHQPWGLEVDVVGWTAPIVVDTAYIADDPLLRNPDRWPDLGTTVHGVSQGETPNGHHRMSLHLSG
jgi:hypothetical protein